MAKSKGLGDTIEKLTKFTGVKPLMTKMNRGKECLPCQHRKKILNNPELLFNKLLYKQK